MTIIQKGNEIKYELDQEDLSRLVKGEAVIMELKIEESIVQRTIICVKFIRNA